MVAQNERMKLEAFARKHGIKLKLLVNDLNKYISEKEGESSWSSKALHRLNGGRRDLGDAPGNRMDEFGMSMRFVVL